MRYFASFRPKYHIHLSHNKISDKFKFKKMCRHHFKETVIQKYIPYPIENSEKRRNLISQAISPFFSPVFLIFDDVSEVSKEGNVW